MWTWTTTDASGGGKARVRDCRLVCQECDHDSQCVSMNLSAFVGVAAAWNGAEEMLSAYEWPAPLRRKLLAFLRDASKLASARA